jgi:hypothetical protein
VPFGSSPIASFTAFLKPLLAAQIPFCGFDGNMSQEKLNLLEFTSCLMAESRACPALMPHAACGAMPNPGLCRIEYEASAFGAELAHQKHQVDSA